MKRIARIRPAWLPKLILAVVSPFVFFGVLEFSLRLTGYGWDTRFFIPDTEGAEDAYRTNPRYTERYFPASFGLKPFNFRIQKSKPDGSKRVFLIGESAAMGVPEPGFGMAPQLEAMLRESFPGESIQVYNLGITAINSHAILPIVRQAVDFDPDLLVFYMGNNEVVGPYGPGSATAGKMPPLAMIRLSLWLKGTRTGQLLSSFIRSTASRQSDWRGMEMFVEKSVPPDDPKLQTTYQNFAANLDAMLEHASDANIPAIVSTVAVNHIDCAPFSPVETDDGRNADSLFHEGRNQMAMGNSEAGARLLRQALEHDALRFRADQRINEIIREATRNWEGVQLVDCAEALFPGGRERFFEHVHLTFEGNFEVARHLSQAVGAKLFPQTPSSGELERDIVENAVGFSEVGRLEQWQSMNDLVTRPPFTGQSTYAEDREHAILELSRLKQNITPQTLAATSSTVENALRQNPSTWLNLYAAKVAVQRSRYLESLAALDAHDRLAPAVAESRVIRGVALAQSGDPEKAVEVFRSIIESEPYYPQTYALLSSLWAAMGQAAKGSATFATWVEEMPTNRGIRIAYAQLLAAQGKMDAAATQWEIVLDIVPDDERALLPLILYRFQQGNNKEAIDRMLAAHAYNPRNFTNNDRLVQVYQQNGDKKATLRFMRDLMDSGPMSEALRRDYQQLQAAMATEER